MYVVLIIMLYNVPVNRDMSELESREHFTSEPFSQPTTNTLLSSQENEKQVPMYIVNNDTS